MGQGGQHRLQILPAALGLPGRLTISVRPRIPAAARDSMARGVTAMDDARMASGIPGAIR